jgi:hypothetical protein
MTSFVTHAWTGDRLSVPLIWRPLTLCQHSWRFGSRRAKSPEVIDGGGARRGIAGECTRVLSPVDRESSFQGVGVTIAFGIATFAFGMSGIGL